MSEQHPTMEEFRAVLNDELRSHLKPIKENQTRQGKDIQSLYREVYGHNGTPGLTTKVQENTTLRRHIYTLYGGFISFIGGAWAYVSNFLK